MKVIAPFLALCASRGRWFIAYYCSFFIESEMKRDKNYILSFAFLYHIPISFLAVKEDIHPVS